MRRISSSATLGLKLFFPTFWVVFFGAFTIAVLSSAVGKSPLFSNWIFKVGLLGFFLLGALILYFTVFRLKRVEIDDPYVYVTNYFKSYRYPFHNIDQIREHNFVFFHLAVIKLKESGTFGKRIFFVQSRQKFEDFLKSYADLAAKLVKED